MVKLSIIVATYNRSAYLLRTLDSLVRQTLPSERFEIVVVDNRSTDDTPEVCERFAAAHPHLRFRRIEEPSQGISFARNRGIAESRGAYVVFIDDDEEAGLHWAESYYRFFEDHPGFDAAGGAVVPVYEAPLPRWYSPYIEKMITGVMDMGPRIVPFRGKRYPGVGNSGFRRSLFDRFGNFDTALGRSGTNPMGGEEKAFAARLRAGGIRYYYIPDAEIYHITPAYKLSETYFERLSRMIGVSERVRTRNEGVVSYGKRLFAEAVKWGGTLVLAAGHALRLHPLKALYLIRMRWNITRGLLTGR